MSEGFVEALSTALVGEPARAVAVAATPAGVLGALSAAGWDAERIRAHAAQVAAAGGPWPHPVSAALRTQVGAARLQAALVAAREQLGLAGVVTAPAPLRAPDADERRLLADKPPHHGG